MLSTLKREGQLLLPESEDCFYQSQSFGKRRATLLASLMRCHNRTLNYKSMKIAAFDIVRSSEASMESAAQARAHDGPGYGCRGHMCPIAVTWRRIGPVMTSYNVFKGGER